MDHPFRRWVDLARPRTELWRTILGGVIVMVVWAVWTVIVGYVAVELGIVSPSAIAAFARGEPFAANHVEAVTTLGVMMATFWGLWFGVWGAVRLIHKRSFASVVDYNQRLNGRQVVIGCAIAAIYLAVGAFSNYLSGATPARSDIPLENWLLALGPLAILIFFQSAGEEIFFRGYLTQQLAAKAPHPVVWGLLPSVTFGLLHASNGFGDPQFATYYVVAATLLGLVMAALVWRTGSIAAAIGFHVANNLGALLLVGVAGTSPPVTLFVVEYREMLAAAPVDILILGLLLAFVLSPFAPLPKGQPLRR